MLVNTIQAELARLQLHAVNLSVTDQDGHLVSLHGSLLQYWKDLATMDGSDLLETLQALPDSAGPQAVMEALAQAHAKRHPAAGAANIAAAPAR